MPYTLIGIGTHYWYAVMLSSGLPTPCTGLHGCDAHLHLTSRSTGGTDTVGVSRDALIPPDTALRQ